MRLAFPIVKERTTFSSAFRAFSAKAHNRTLSWPAAIDRRVRSLPASLTCGGADRDRTDDPLLAKQVLSQLSYSPAPCLARGVCVFPVA